MQPQVKECWQLREVGEAKMDPSLNFPEEVWPSDTDFGFLEGNKYVILGHPVCDHLLQQPHETNTTRKQCASNWRGGRGFTEALQEEQDSF